MKRAKIITKTRLFRIALTLFCASILFTSCGVLRWSDVLESQPSGYTSSEGTKPNGSPSNKPKETSPEIVKNASKPSSKPKRNPNFANRQQSLLDVYSGWKGTPYRLGGNSKSGIDCSAFVQIAMDEAFEKQLSRTTTTQRREGKEITLNELQTGDLVFFQTGKNTWHVGIYLTDMQFMHASVTYGVSVSDMNNTYWKRRYKGARRVL